MAMNDVYGLLKVMKKVDALMEVTSETIQARTVAFEWGR
jgi:hypothetical protein